MVECKPYEIRSLSKYECLRRLDFSRELPCYYSSNDMFKSSGVCTKAPGEGADHKGLAVRRLPLHFCKRQFPRRDGYNFTSDPKDPLRKAQYK